jgi:hypothetical protein
MNWSSMMGSMAVVLTGASLAFGQPTPAPRPSPETAPSDQATPQVPAGVKQKQAACGQEGSKKGMRGVDLQDYVAICVLEARLACLKQAVADKIRPPSRRDFISKCMGES